MTDVQPSRSDAWKRYTIAKAVQTMLTARPELANRVWNIYLHPGTRRITVVTHDSALDAVAHFLRWVPDLETRRFTELASKLVLGDHTDACWPGLSLSQIQARLDLHDLLCAALPAVFPGKVRGIGVDALAEAPPAFFAIVDPTIHQRVVDLLSEVLEISVVSGADNSSQAQS